MAGRKNVAVIGAGPSGLVSIKTLLADGHDVTCFELNPTIGGLWNYEAFKTDSDYRKELNPEEPVQSVYKSLLLNTSREISAFSDFLDRDAKSAFLNHWEYRDYLERYAKRFDLERHIRLETKVTRLDKQKDGWMINFEDKSKGSGSEHFDSVVIATGCFKYPNIPHFAGMKEQYKGVALHTSQVRDEAIFKDKRVLVIGGGYSGYELAVGALDCQAAKMYFCFTNESDKRNHWAMPRFVPGLQGTKAPWDHCVTRYEYFEHNDQFGARLTKWLTLLHSKDGKGELCFPGDRVALTNLDTLSGGMKSGKLEKVGPIDHFESKDVVLADGTRLSNIDFVVMGTGFWQRYPFLNEIWSPEDQMQCELYKYMILPEQKMDGLAFVLSCPSPLALIPTMEMQARWISNQLVPRRYDASGNLFTETERQAMRDEVKATRQAQPNDLPYNYLVDGPGYSDKLAKEMHCDPPTYEQLRTTGGKPNKRLAVALQYGPILGTHYRLQGPGKWGGACDWIISVEQRVLGAEKMEEYCK